MLEHSASKLGDKETEHWAITAQLSPAAQDKAEINIYETNNLDRLQATMAGRSSVRGKKGPSSSLEVCPLQDNISPVETNSTGGRDSENGSQNGNWKLK